MKGGCMFWLVAASLALAGCGLIYPSESMRYRMTVVIDTPDGERSGSSVIEASISQGPSFGPDAPGISHGLKGEAIAVELPGGKVMFALLAPQDGSDPTGYHVYLFERAVKRDPALAAQFDPTVLGDWRQFWPEVRRRKLGIELRQPDYPMLVTFGDMGDPTSVKLVDPDDLAATFGEGVSLKRITVQITDDPVTTGIEQRLGWWQKIREAGGGLIPMERFMINGRSRYKVASGYDATLADIGLSQFSTEAYK